MGFSGLISMAYFLGDTAPGVHCLMNQGRLGEEEGEALLLTWVSIFTAAAVPLGQRRHASHSVVEGLLHEVRHGPEVLPLLLLLAGDISGGQAQGRKGECEAHCMRESGFSVPAEVQHRGPGQSPVQDTGGWLW